MEKNNFYLTKKKLEEVKKEYAQLVEFEKNKVVGVEAPKIFESEDMNPEFIAYHEDMDALRARIAELKNVLDNHALIKKPPKEKQSVVDMGAKVTVDMGGGKQASFTIMSTLEANPNEGKISNESPVGMALLGKKIGDEIEISHPKKAVYKIKDIAYEIG